MFDGSTELFERIKRTDTAVIIPVVGNKLLLEIQEQPDITKPFTTFPSGRLEEGEEPLVAAKRELLEETGYASAHWQLWHTYGTSSIAVWNVHMFVARNCTRVQEPHPDAGEKITTRLITFDEFLMLSEDSSFRGKELVTLLLRARLDAKVRQELYELLFGDNSITTSTF